MRLIDLLVHNHGDILQKSKFTDDASTLCLTTQRILHGESDIVGVVRDHDGDWLFLDGQPLSPEQGAMVCLGCLLRDHPEIDELGDLETGWQAWLADGAWQRSHIPLEDD